MHNYIKPAMLVILVLIFSSPGHAEVDFRVSIVSSQIQDSTDLGVALIEGVGEVSLIARKNGNELVIHAKGSNGKVIGKAETVVGLNQTPIFVITPEGLKKIIIMWGVNAQ